MWRQAIALVHDHSFSIVPPIWWGSYLTSSSRGIGVGRAGLSRGCRPALISG